MPTTANGLSFEMMEPHDGTPPPMLLLFASVGAESLNTEPYCRVGKLLHKQGWNVVSLDLPCHGADRCSNEPMELEGWAARIKKGEDIVALFKQRVNEVIKYLVTSKMADLASIVVAGTSRGGFMAFHAAAGNPYIRAVAAFSPVTDLAVLKEFDDQKDNPLVKKLALINTVEELADRAVWIAIGNADKRVSTDRAIDFVSALTADKQARSLEADITFRLLSTPGHVSFPEWHDEAAAWFSNLQFIQDYRIITKKEIIK